MSNFERIYLEKLIQMSKGDIGEAIRLSGLSRSNVYSRMKKHNLSLKQNETHEIL